MNRLEAAMTRYFFSPVAAVRPYLMLKGTLFLLGFDLLVERIEHGGRYGVGGFNVAHADWLDTIQPTVSSSLYVGLTIATALACLILAALPKPPRWAIGGVALAHTWAWAMSLLDAYQHHYLISIVLGALAFFPRLGPRDTEATEENETSRNPNAPPPCIEAPAYITLSASFAIVYAYTAYSKTARAWLEGDALQRVTGNGEKLFPIRDVFQSLGMESATFWSMMGHSVVFVQLICAAGFLLAPLYDRKPPRAIHRYRYVALFTALSFHFGAEYLELKIGWFSWYMMFYAFVIFLPADWLMHFVRMELPSRYLRRPQMRALWPRPQVRALWPALCLCLLMGVLSWSAELTELLWLPSLALLISVPLRMASGEVCTPIKPAWLGLVAVGAACALLAWASHWTDLPGAQNGGTLIAVIALISVILAPLISQPNASRSVATATLFAALVLIGTMQLSEARFDFYRNVGGDHRRRQALVPALAAYQAANRYAPTPEHFGGDASIPIRAGQDAHAAVTIESERGVHTLWVEAELLYPDPNQISVTLTHRPTDNARGRRGEPQTHTLTATHQEAGTWRFDDELRVFGRRALAGTWTLNVQNEGNAGSGSIRRFAIRHQNDRRREARELRRRLGQPGDES